MVADTMRKPKVPNTYVIIACILVLCAALAMARIPFTQWAKWIWKTVVVLLLLGLLLLLPTALWQIAGF